MKRFITLSLLALYFLSGNSFTSMDGTLDEAKRTKVTKEILNNLIKESYEDARKDFDPEFRKNLSAEKIGEVWKQVVSQNGNFSSVTTTSVGVTQGFNKVIMRLAFEDGKATLESIFNTEDKVIGLFLRP